MSQQIHSSVNCYQQSLRKPFFSWLNQYFIISDVIGIFKTYSCFICKIMLSEKYMKMIQAIEAKGCSRSQKIQDLINIFAKIIGDNLQHITGPQIVKGNLNHIYNLLQVLEYFSGYMDGQHSQFNMVVKSDQQNKSESENKSSDEPNYILPKGITSSSHSKNSIPSNQSNKSHNSFDNNQVTKIQKYKPKKQKRRKFVKQQSSISVQETQQADEMYDIKLGNLKEHQNINTIMQRIQSQKKRLLQARQSKQYQVLNEEIVNNIEILETKHDNIIGYFDQKYFEAKKVETKMKVRPKNVTKVVYQNVYKTNLFMKTKHLEKLAKQKERLEYLTEFDDGAGQKVLKWIKQLRQSSIVASSQSSKRSSDRNY